MRPYPEEGLVESTFRAAHLLLKDVGLAHQKPKAPSRDAIQPSLSPSCQRGVLPSTAGNIAASTPEPASAQLPTMSYGKKDEDADLGLVKVDRTQVFQEGECMAIPRHPPPQLN